MKKPKRGRPPKEPGQLHDESLLVRMRSDEKQAFRDAAELSGAENPCLIGFVCD
jgi:hypothetical protein